MSAIDDIHAKLRADGLISATEAVIYAQHQLKPLTEELVELRRTVESLRGIAADAVKAEREACAKIADARAVDGGYGTWQAQEGKIIAHAIRNRT